MLPRLNILLSIALLSLCSCQSKKEFAQSSYGESIENLSSTSNHIIDSSLWKEDSLLLNSIKIEFFPSDSASGNKIKSITHLNIEKIAKCTHKSIVKDSAIVLSQSQSITAEEKRKISDNNIFSIQHITCITLIIILLFTLIKYIFKL